MGMISHDYNFIFIHPMKTSGSSIQVALKDYGTASTARIENADQSIKHMRAKELKRIVGSDFWQGAFKFAFVRNPWDRLVSFYFHKKSENSKVTRNYESFSDFVHRHPVRIGRWGPLVDFICNEKKEIMIDFVGRYETLVTDFREIASRLGISSETELQHINKSNHECYRSYYYDDDLVNVVYDKYKDDIEVFDYDY